MASSSLPPSPGAHIKRYDVFPSFNGPDVRKRFLSHLHHYFACKGIKMYKDNNNMERCHTIKRELRQAIKESRVLMVLLSKNYASSSWCLDELVEILKCRKDKEHIVMPIFYDVDPSHVRTQSGDFGIAFEKPAKTQTEELKQRWVEALKRVTTIAGEHSRNWTDEAEMVQKLCTDVSTKLRVEEIKDEFRKYDVDKNGFITAAELPRCVLIKDGDGQINFDEFVQLMALRMSDEKLYTDQVRVEMMKEDFRECDVDKNGFITPPELRYVLTKDGEEFTDKQVRKIIRVADVDGDGQLNYDEFFKVMMHVKWRPDDRTARIEKITTYVSNKLNKFSHMHGKSLILKKKIKTIYECLTE
ncbi:disease resistance protein ADR2 isoform X2 [Eutrema salsugineum]|uniref:disease resistance protein ADR2 isoform X2 n=1 Tax=Eutrema salsugineum TaxID=72664 RepID=UPI000CED3FF5|nr:disease resistance protein ADR2 isoform X2 [Eutrema salsugineum]